LQYNKEGKGDQACFFCVKAGSSDSQEGRA